MNLMRRLVFIAMSSSKEGFGLIVFQRAFDSARRLRYHRKGVWISWCLRTSILSEGIEFGTLRT